MNSRTTSPLAQGAPADPETIPATYLRLHTRDLLERVKYKGERFLVETFGRPMGVLISYQDFLSVRDLLCQPLHDDSLDRKEQLPIVESNIPLHDS